MQPGETIQPGGVSPEEPKQPEVIQDVPAQEVSAPAQTLPQEPPSQWQFSDDGQTEQTQSSGASGAHATVTWTASEYVAHEKTISWYLALSAATILFAALIYFLTKELLSPVVILVMGLAFGAFAARQPEELTYVLDGSALHVGQKSFPYAQFKSFTIIEEGAIHSIVLMPMQRFMPPLSVYFDPADEDKIADALSSYLPYEDRKQDYIDRLMRKVRF